MCKVDRFSFSIKGLYSTLSLSLEPTLLSVATYELLLSTIVNLTFWEFVAKENPLLFREGFDSPEGVLDDITAPEFDGF